MRRLLAVNSPRNCSQTANSALKGSERAIRSARGPWETRLKARRPRLSPFVYILRKLGTCGSVARSEICLKLAAPPVESVASPHHPWQDRRPESLDRTQQLPALFISKRAIIKPRAAANGGAFLSP